jgi:two-component system NtrC family sensor kinase
MTNSPTRILVVEDEVVVAESLRMTLTRLGYAVPALVLRAEEVLPAVRRTQPDLILMDIRLRGEKDGITAAEEVRAEYDVPIVYLTAYTDKATLCRAKETLPFGYLIKPFQQRTLHSTIEMSLHKHRLERQLAESEARFSQVVEQMPYPVLVCSPEGTVEAVNTAHLDTFGLSKAKDVVGTYNVFEDPHLAHHPELRERVATAYEGETVFLPEVTIPARVRHGAAGGDSLICEVTTFPVLSPRGELLHVVTIFKDVTERKRALDALKQRNEDLAAINKAHRAITSTLELDRVLKLVAQEMRALLKAEGVSVLLLDPQGEQFEFVAVAGTGSDALPGVRMPVEEGVAGEALRARAPQVTVTAQESPHFYGAIDELTGMRTRSLIAVPLLSQEDPIGVLEAVNWEDRFFDEHELHLLTTMASTVSVAIENARLFEAEREQRRLVEHAHAQLAQSEKLAATGRLAASLAHEINNPLQAIRNSLQIMLTYSLEEGEKEQYLEMIDEEVERLMGMVGRILDFSRKTERAVSPLDVNEILNKVLTLAHKYLQHRHVVLRQHLAPGLPPVVGSASELGQIFLNLVLNAVDAMPEGGTLTVRSGGGEDGRLVVSVRDTGVGIPPENLERIFEPFFSTKQEGTGMGLAVSRTLVRRHGGTLEAESPPGEGATFTVRLPVSEGAEP